MSAPRGLLEGLLVVGVAAAVGVIAWRALDVHSHSCPCGRTWTHAGAFKFGEDKAHACPACGRVWWLRDGAPPELRARYELEQRRAA